jgi:glycosyltransferase involved in cell wall biosynthesis
MAQTTIERAVLQTGPTSLSVVIPAYNEARSIRGIVERVLDELPQAEVVVVDDGSADDTGGQLSGLPVQVVRHPYNKGNGAAVKSGLRAAQGEWVLLLDADGQHNTSDIHHILALTDDYDLIVGARDTATQASVGRLLGNQTLNWLAGYVVGRPVPDLTSGFRAMRREVAHEFIHLLPNGYSYTTTSTLCFFKAGYSVAFVPLRARKRVAGKSRIRLATDGARFITIVLRILTLFSPLKLFVPLSVALLALGLLSMGYTFIFERFRIPNSTVVLTLASVFIFLMGLVSEQIAALRFERHGH